MNSWSNSVIGGAVLIAVDYAGLRDYTRINPSVRTLDDFIEILVESGFISDEVTDRCELEATLTTTRNFQITLSANNNDDAAYCSATADSLAKAINDPSSISDDSLFVQVPEVLQFASAAITASNELSDNGAPVFKALSYLTIVLLNIVVLLTF